MNEPIPAIFAEPDLQKLRAVIQQELQDGESATVSRRAGSMQRGIENGQRRKCNQPAVCNRRRADWVNL